MSGRARRNRHGGIAGDVLSGLSRRAVCVAGAAFAAAGLCLAAAPFAGAAEDRVVLLVDGEHEHVFTAEIADDPFERARGLMFRREMASNHGMLFDFAAEREVGFWMKNTPLSLDMIFVEADGDIVRIAEDTVPLSEETVPSGAPVRFVFEVLAGTADRIGLEPGDRLLHPRVVDE